MSMSEQLELLPSNRFLHPLILLNRLAVGWYVVNAGWEKVRDEVSGGLGTFLLSNSFQNRSPWLPEFMAAPFGYSWPWLEFGFGLLLLVGLFGRISAAVTAGLLLCISISLLFVGELLPRHQTMVMIPISLMLVLTGPGRYSLDALIHGRKA